MKKINLTLNCRVICMLRQAGVTALLLATSVWSQDSIAVSQGGLVAKKRYDANGWVFTLADENAGSSIDIFQEGANIKKFIMTVGGIAYSIFLEKEGNFKMMPWANRTANGRFTDDDGVEHILAKNIHGLVRKKDWKIEDIGVDDDGVYINCYVDAKDHSEISSIFGDFRDHSVYHLKGHKLIIDAYTENMSLDTIKNIGWGWHPWINAPLIPIDSAQKGSQDMVAFTMPATKIAMYDAQKIPTGVIEDVATYNAGYFDFTSLKFIGGISVDHFFTGLMTDTSGYTRSVYIDYGNNVRIHFLGQFPFYHWMVMYIPQDGNVIAVEHQTQEVNALNTRKDLFTIPPNGSTDTGRVIMFVDGDTTLDYPEGLVVETKKEVGNIVPAPGLSYNTQRITYTVPGDNSPVRLGLYNIQGRLVKQLVDRVTHGGTYTIERPFKELIQTGRMGVYFLELKMGAQSISRKIVLLP